MSKKLEYAKVITQYKITIPVEIRNLLKLNVSDWIIFDYNKDSEIITISKSQ